MPKKHRGLRQLYGELMAEIRARKGVSIVFFTLRTIVLVTLVAGSLYLNGLLPVPFLLVAPMTVVVYLALSLLLRKRVIEEDRIMREKERNDPEITPAAPASE